MWYLYIVNWQNPPKFTCFNENTLTVLFNEELKNSDVTAIDLDEGNKRLDR